MGIQVTVSVNEEEYEALRSEGFEPASMTHATWADVLDCFGGLGLSSDEGFTTDEHGTTDVLEGHCSPELILANADNALFAAKLGPTWVLTETGGMWLDTLTTHVEDVITIASMAHRLGLEVAWG